MPRKQSKTQDSPLIREQLNVIIALLLILVGNEGQKELMKKRKANAGLVRYFSDKIKLSNKDLAAIFNTTESGISNLKTKRK